MTDIERLTEQLAAAEARAKAIQAERDSAMALYGALVAAIGAEHHSTSAAILQHAAQLKARADALQSTLAEEREFHRHYMLQAGDQFTRQALAIDALQAERDDARLYHEMACPSLTKNGPCSCQPVSVSNGSGDELAWLNLEQKQASRWGYSQTGVYRFQLTGPELMRIRRGLERLGAEKARADAAERALREFREGHERLVKALDPLFSGGITSYDPSDVRAAIYDARYPIHEQKALIARHDAARHEYWAAVAALASPPVQGATYERVEDSSSTLDRVDGSDVAASLGATPVAPTEGK